jgi:spore germination protein GerM
MEMPPHVSALMVTLYVAHYQDGELYLLPVLHEVKEVTPLQALRALVEYPNQGDTEGPLPPGTKVLGLKIDPSGTAVADFSREIRDRFQGGARREQILLAAVADTLTEFLSVQRVEVRVEGKELDSIGGHVDLAEPLERDLEFVLPPHPSMPCGGRKGAKR